MARIEVGWREWLALPDLEVPAIKAKIDTGARTSALHVCELDTFVRNGRTWVRYRLHPLQRRTDIELERVAEVADLRTVRNSGGQAEERIIVMSTVVLAGLRWSVEIGLARRDDMLFRMLLGRSALDERFVVNPARSYLHGRPARPRRALAR